MGAEVIPKPDGSPAPGTRARDSRPHLGTKDSRRAAGGQAPLQPTVAPGAESAALELGVRTRRLDEALATAAFAAPAPRQGGMAGELQLILERASGVRQEAPQLGNGGRHCLQEIGVHQGSHGWRGRRTSPSQDHLHPQAFPT